MITDPKCFAAKKGGAYCTATTYTDCKGEKCPFYKTREQLAESQRKADERNKLIERNGAK